MFLIVSWAKNVSHLFWNRHHLGFGLAPRLEEELLSASAACVVMVTSMGNTHGAGERSQSMRMNAKSQNNPSDVCLARQCQVGRSDASPPLARDKQPVLRGRGRARQGEAGQQDGVWHGRARQGKAGTCRAGQSNIQSAHGRAR